MSIMSEIENCNADKVISIPEHCAHSITHREMALVRGAMNAESPASLPHSRAHNHLSEQRFLRSYAWALLTA